MIKVKPTKALIVEIAKRLSIFVIIFAIAIIILMTPEDECISFLGHSLCNGIEKWLIVKWIFFFDSILLAYIALPILHYVALRFLIRHKNRR
ncbi:hypothetical protein [Shewanella ulleungensis]|uniref:Uncharacterized protein n=1 Tax=Shewanella ulleungensis TaxID=2282699 RepID=A0ABQ2QB82_9GAMM|nr:hypothetical protein [Shewanella ulleungensis]MCL1149220.1 hypothetical protein [Shewanella ulleungensis]GGP72797.1 hypothetical protein GCM10009410_00260 [Shewanella ulleungensis]